MRVTIFGATGGTGRHLVRQALDAGHEVTAVARDPGRLGVAHPRLRVVVADVLDPASIKPAVDAADALVSAIGPRRGGSMTICSDATTSIIEAMHASGVRRLVVVSASPVAPYDDPGDRLLYRTLVKRPLRRLLAEGYADLERMEAATRASGLDWTIMRPPRLTNRPGGRRYRTARNHNVPGGYFLARADLARGMLAALTDPTTVQATVGIGN